MAWGWEMWARAGSGRVWAPARQAGDERTTHEQERTVCLLRLGVRGRAVHRRDPRSDRRRCVQKYGMQCGYAVGIRSQSGETLLPKEAQQSKPVKILQNFNEKRCKELPLPPALCTLRSGVCHGLGV